MCLRDFTQEIQEIFKIHHEHLSRKFMTRIMMFYFNLVIGWRMQGWLKGQSHIAIMVPGRRLSRAIAATFWPRGRRALRARRPRGPNVKNAGPGEHEHRRTNRQTDIQTNIKAIIELFATAELTKSETWKNTYCKHISYGPTYNTYVLMTLILHCKWLRVPFTEQTELWYWTVNELLIYKHYLNRYEYGGYSLKSNWHVVVDMIL